MSARKTRAGLRPLVGAKKRTLRGRAFRADVKALFEVFCLARIGVFPEWLDISAQCHIGLLTCNSIFCGMGKSKNRRLTLNTESTNSWGMPWFFTYMKPVFDRAQRICLATACLLLPSRSGAISTTGILSKLSRFARSLSSSPATRSTDIGHLGLTEGDGSTLAHSFSSPQLQKYFCRITFSNLPSYARTTRMSRPSWFQPLQIDRSDISAEHVGTCRLDHRE